MTPFRSNMTASGSGVPRVILALGLALANMSSAHAKPIDLSKPWGNKDGCANRVQQEYYSDAMLLVTADALVTAASACTFTGKTIDKDGSVTLMADCEAEGEEGKTPASFTLKRDPKNAKGLIVSDETGFVMGQVSQCR